MSLSVNSVAPQSVNDTIELTWYEDSYTTMMLPDGTFSFGQGETVYYSLKDGDLPQFFYRLYPYDLFSGTAGQSDVGDYTFVISATTDDITYEVVTIHLTVVNVNDAPTLLYGGISDQTIEAGSAFSFTDTPFYFKDQDGDTLTYSATLSDGSALPDWLKFNTATGAFSGTPARTDAGTVSVKVTATDPSNATRSDIFDITVSAPPNTAPTGSPSAVLPHGTEDTTYVVTLATLLQGFTDADGDTLEIMNIVAMQGSTRLPTVTTKSGNLKITPDKDSDKDISLTYTVSDGNGGTINAEHIITVDSENDKTIVANPVANQVATEDKEFEFRLPNDTFYDVDDPSVHVRANAVVGGKVVQLPDWLQFRATGPGTGIFSGTPSNADVGPLTILLSANGVTDEFVINVKNVNDAPDLDLMQKDSKIPENVKPGTEIARIIIDDDDSSKFSVNISDNIKGDKNYFTTDIEYNDPIDAYILSVHVNRQFLSVAEVLEQFRIKIAVKDIAGAQELMSLMYKMKHLPSANESEHGSVTDHSDQGFSQTDHHHDWSM